MKVQLSHAVRWVVLFLLMVLVTGKSLGQNSVIYAYSPVFFNGVSNGPSGEQVTINTQLSYGNFNGLGNQYLYQYNITNTGLVSVDGFNLFTEGAAALNAANPAATAIANATAVAGNNLAASAQDPGGLGAGGTLIPATAAAAAPFNTIPALLTTASSSGNPTQYIFTTPLGNLNHAVNLDTTIGPANGDPIFPSGQSAQGLNWGFTFWSDGAAGDSLSRWFAETPGVDSLGAGKSLTFDLFSPNGPVAGGAFPDPQGPEDVFMTFDDVNGDISSALADTDAVAPEPSTYALIAGGLLALGAFLRQRRRA